MYIHKTDEIEDRDTQCSKKETSCIWLVFIKIAKLAEIFPFQNYYLHVHVHVYVNCFFPVVYICLLIVCTCTSSFAQYLQVP